MDTNARPSSYENDHQDPQPSTADVVQKDTRCPLPILSVEYGSGWYHDAAIKDHERSLRRGD